jgi:hypothetical protein
MYDVTKDTPVGDVVNARTAVYGDPKKSFARIAQMWTAILDCDEIQPWEVPLMLAALKIIRTTQTPDYSDNSDDIEGYVKVFKLIMGDDMIQASSVTDYVLQRES